MKTHKITCATKRAGIVWHEPWLLILSIAFMAMGCELRQEPAIDQKQVDAFRKDSGEVTAFEKKFGEITKFALPPFMAAASKYTNSTYAYVDSVISIQPQTYSKPGQVSVTTGVHHFMVLDSATQQGTAIGRMTFENVSNQPVALMLEATTIKKKFSGFSYVQLAPGDRFVYEHNELTAGVAIIVIGGGLLIAIELVDRGFADAWRCHLELHSVLPDYCAGHCWTGERSCTEVASKPYGMGITQATSCKCK